MGKCEEQIAALNLLMERNTEIYKAEKKKLRNIQRKMSMERLCYIDVENTPEQKENSMKNILSIVDEIKDQENVIKKYKTRYSEFYRERYKVEKYGLDYINKKTKWKD